MSASPHKKTFGWVKWLAIFFIVIALFWLVQQVFLKPVIEGVASRVVGARITMGSFSINVLTNKIRITDLTVYNEEGFPSQAFFKAPEILVDADLAQAIKGKLHFPLIIFRLEKMMVFKNAQGKLNVNELKIVQEKLHEKNKGPATNFKIDELKLDIGEVIFEDDGKTPPVIEAYDLHLKNKTIRNIDGVPKLVGAVMFEALKPTAIQGAGMYAATTLLGVGFLPGLAVGVIIAKDDAIEDLPYSGSRVYQKSLELVQRLGKLKKEDAGALQIFAKVYNCDITIQIEKEGWLRSKITIKARKYFLAQPSIAAGLLYQLKGQLK